MPLTHLKIPCAVLLRRLPKELQGPAWRSNVFPDVVFLLPRSPVLLQLKKGRVLFPLAQFIADIPSGWLKPDAKLDTLVELDLAGLIQAIPCEMLKTAEKDEEMPEDMSKIRDFFEPKKPDG